MILYDFKGIKTYYSNYFSTKMEINEFVKELNAVINPNQDNTQQSTSTDNVSITLKPVSSKKVKVMIVSTHLNQVNGYSKVTMNLINQLAAIKWIQVVHFGTQKINNADVRRKYPTNVKVIDGSSLEKDKTVGYSFAELPSIILSEKPDVVFIYNDIAVVCGYIEEIRKTITNRFFKIWAYVDLVYEAPQQALIDVINRDVERIFCFTKLWKEHLKSRGITRPVDVINHAIDNKTLKTIPRELARQSIGLPRDVFLFTSINRNIPRKRLDLLIISFVKLIVRFPLKNILLLIVSNTNDKGGYNLFEIFSRELKLAGASPDIFGNRLLITLDNNRYTDDDINLLYNCGDAGVSCAEGEGFGLCTFEQMSLGIPQIVPKVTGHLEYCNDENSLIVKPKFRYYIPQAYNTVTGEAHMVDPDDVSKAMERYVFDEDLRKLHGKLGKEKVSEYTWEKCCSVLVKRLTALQEEED
jgi:glycosyltransferase involved in cell wall biosynthesis